MINRPENVDTAIYYMRYIELVTGEDLLPELEKNLQDTLSLVATIRNQDLNFAYAEGKWRIGVLLQHICDAERVYAYRALRFLRADTNNLPGFDEDAFASNSIGYTSVEDFIEEFTTIRKASISLFKNSDLKHIDFVGSANNLEMTPRILGWLMLGHNLHHVKVLQERYLSN
jgi:hypothetical protein